MALDAFKARCRELLAQGIKPTATEFARRGWPYVTVPQNRLYAREGHKPIQVPGSQVAFNHGKYTAARAEVFAEFGWKYDTGKGRWYNPNG